VQKDHADILETGAPRPRGADREEQASTTKGSDDDGHAQIAFTWRPDTAGSAVHGPAGGSV